jgi:hypothetical protein
MLAGGVLVIVAVTAAVITGTAGSAAVLTNGSPPGGDYVGGIAVPTGQVADFPVTVENTGSAPVTLQSVRLIPLPGFRLPRLVHVGVLAEHKELLSAARGWPIRESGSPPSEWALRPLRGYVVLPWGLRQSRHLGPLQDMIEYGVQAATPRGPI